MKIKKVNEGTYRYRVSKNIELFVDADSKKEAKKAIKAILAREERQHANRP